LDPLLVNINVELTIISNKALDVSFF